MASINSVVSIQIAANSRTPSVPGFGTPLVLTYHVVFPELYRDYTDLLGMETDGFSQGSNAYRMAAAVWGQNPTVPSIRVGRVATAPAFSQDLTITSAVEGQHIRAKVIDSTGAVQQLDYTILASATTTTVATAFEALVEAVTGVSSAPSAAVITITPASATGYSPFLYDIENATIVDTTPVQAAYTAALSALELAGNDFYFIVPDVSSDANVLPMAAWALARKNTNPKLLFVSTQSSAELDGTGTLGATLKGLSNDRTVILYTPNPQEYGAAAWTGKGGPKVPGSATWANKELAGVVVSSLSATQEGNLTTDNINNYQLIANLGATRPGVVTSGEWIDVVHGVDALKADIQASVWTVIANSDKVPYTDAGLDLIASAILAALKRFEGTDPNQTGLLVRGSSKVIMPSAASISAADKRNRILRNVRFSALFEGAVHAVQLVGTLTY